MNPLSDEEFDALVSAFLDGCLDDAGQKRLIDAAREAPSRGEMLASAYRNHCALRRLHSMREDENFAREVLEAIQPANNQFNRRLMDSVRRRATRPAKPNVNLRLFLGAVGALAASLLLILGLGVFSRTPSSTSGTNPPVPAKAPEKTNQALEVERIESQIAELDRQRAGLKQKQEDPTIKERADRDDARLAELRREAEQELAAARERVQKAKDASKQKEAPVPSNPQPSIALNPEPSKTPAELPGPTVAVPVVVGSVVFAAGSTLPQTLIVRTDGTQEKLSTKSVLRSGDRIESAHSAGKERPVCTVLALSNGSTVELADGTAVVLRQASDISLERGLLFVSVEKDTAVEARHKDYKFTVRTPRGSVGVMGTQFELASNDVESTVRMAAGRVDFFNDKGKVSVGTFEESSARDGQAPEAPRAGTPATLWRGRKKLQRGALLISGFNQPSAAEDALLRRMQGLGFAARSVNDELLKPADLNGVSVLLICNSVKAPVILKQYGPIPAGVVCLDPGSFQAFGLTARGADDAGSNDASNSPGTIAIPDHFLAAGLTGAPRLVNGRAQMNFGIPGPNVTGVLADNQEKSHYRILACESAARTLVGAAPARRVGIFLRSEEQHKLTSEGWRLLDAAVLWAGGFSP